MTRVLLVALDGATRSILSPLLDAKATPTLAGLVEFGASGPLACPPPLVRSMAFTTLATGVCAPRHGVAADVVVRPDGAGIAAAGHAAWQWPAMWETLAAAGVRSAAIGWPATAPAASWDGVTLVDDVYADPQGASFDAWPLAHGCVQPATLRDALRPLRVHPADLDGDAIVALVPEAARVDQDEDARIAGLARTIARSAGVHAAATHVAIAQAPAFMAVCYPLLADAQREFLGFRPPASPGADRNDARIYGPVIDRVARLQDALLGVLVEAMGAGTTVIVVAPYGFATGAARPAAVTAPQAHAALAWHRAPGWLVARGPGIAADSLVHDARVEDVAATVLGLFGLAQADLDGRCLGSLVPDAPRRRIASPLRAMSPPVHDFADDDLTAPQQHAVATARLAGQLARAEALLAHGDVAEAAAIYVEVLRDVPGDWPLRVRLARCRLQLGELDACAALAAEIVAAAPDRPWGYLVDATVAVLRRDTARAGRMLEATRERAAALPNVSLRLASLYLLHGDSAAAESLYRAALAAMPTSVDAHDGLGCALHAQGRHAEAVDVLRAGLGHAYHAPLAHVHLGLALMALGRAEDAADAARTARVQDADVPGLTTLEQRVAHALAGRSRSVS